jgi:protein-S-isoprenylcysteine O-methyltransferase Ste14
MGTSLEHVIDAMWLAWAAYWAVSALRVKRTRWREPLARRALHDGPLLLGVYLLLAPGHLPGRLPGFLTERLLPASVAVAGLATVLTAVGLAFAIWARWNLGGNWSGTITVKEGHSLVRSGPYRRIRHPIYSGLLLAIVGSALTAGDWRGLLALLLVLLAVLLRIRVEERQMAAAFPDYGGYRRQSVALIPFLY